MFRGPSEITPVIDLLEARGCSLWHACQLRDLESYVSLGGVPSRSLLEQAGVAFTRFATDATDRTKGMWPKVFVNLGDFGRSYAFGATAMPNPYGPIAFQIRPGALRRASDVSITLRSAGAHDFDRDAESLATVDDVNRLFACSQADNPLDQSSLLFGERLREAFAPLHPYATAAEVSLTIEPELVPMAEVIAIWVDPVETRDARLLDIVSGQAALTVQSPPVRRRYIREPRGVIYRDIVAFIADEGRPKSSVACGSLRRGRGDATVGARFDRSRPGLAIRTVRPVSPRGHARSHHRAQRLNACRGHP